MKAASAWICIIQYNRTNGVYCIHVVTDAASICVVFSIYTVHVLHNCRDPAFNEHVILIYDKTGFTEKIDRSFR